MDGTKPSTSNEGFDGVSSNSKDLMKRLFDAVEIVQVETFHIFEVFSSISKDFKAEEVTIRGLP